MAYQANEKRYDDMIYNRCGKSGILLPAISLGLWQNFGQNRTYETMKDMLQKAFDMGITHFDLANNYGPPYGAAETNFGQIFKESLKPYRDELLISSKAGYDMWKGPYGNWGSRKYLISSCDQSLQRMGLDYVDIFYHHRPDPNTPIEETMSALSHLVHQGKALYVGLSNYNAEQAKEAIMVLKSLGTPCLIHQPSYSMVNRWIEEGLQDVLAENGVGTIGFLPLAMGLLTNKYLNGIPEGSRAANNTWVANNITEEKLQKVRLLNEIALERQQTMAQLALAWVLRDGKVTSALIGASSVAQLEENVGALKHITFTNEELTRINEILI